MNLQFQGKPSLQRKLALALAFYQKLGLMIENRI
jgi:hypothetical protein